MDAQIISEYGGIFTPLLLLAYIIWQIIKEVGKREDPTHANLEAHMAQCEARLNEKVREVKTDIAKCNSTVTTVAADTAWLKDVHDRRDEDGLPIWYNKRSLENRIISLADCLEGQTHSIDRLCNLLEAYAKKPD